MEAFSPIFESKINDVLKKAAASISSFKVFNNGAWECYYVSQGCQKIYGYTPEEMINQPELWLLGIEAEDWKTLEANLNNVFTCKTFTIEYRYNHKDGNIRWLSSIITSQKVENYWDVTTVDIDISERKQAEKRQGEIQERYLLAINANNDAIWEWNVINNKVFFSPRWKRILGYQDDELENNLNEWTSHIHIEDISIVNKAIKDHLTRKNHRYFCEYRVQCKDGSYKWILDRGQAVWDQQGNLQKIVGSYTDITENKNLEFKKDLEQERWHIALEAFSDGLWDWNINTGEFYFDETWLTSLGYEINELAPSLTVWNNLIHPEDKVKIIGIFKPNLQDNIFHYEFDYRLLNKAGEWQWINNYCQVKINEINGQAQRIIGIQKNITESKQTEEKIKAALNQQELLLKEIHHRIKNNLHVVSNLLDLQSDTLEDEKLISFFTECHNRIQAMALVHEQLYQSENLGYVQFGEYIRNLMNNLLDSFADYIDGIVPIIEVEPVYLNLETAVSCGLLINELVTNSFKYAFPDNRQGEIHIELYEDSSYLINLLVWDNGVGIPPDFNWEKTSSLGMKLVRILSKQLKAKLSFDLNHGTSIKLTFTNPKYKSDAPIS